MMVKDNQPALKTDLQTLFARPPGPGQDLRMAHHLSKGHGRLEERTLSVSADLAAYLDWPGLQQALCLVCTRVNTQTGEVTTSRRFAITSLPLSQPLLSNSFDCGADTGRLKTTCTIRLMCGSRRMLLASALALPPWPWLCCENWSSLSSVPSPITPASSTPASISPLDPAKR